MSKRAGPPLFELLRKQSDDAPAGQPQRRDPDPAVPWTGAAVTRAERSAAALDEEPRQQGELRLPVTRVYLAVAIMLAAVLGAWAAGHHFGVQSGKAQMDRIVRGEPVVLPPETGSGDTQARQPPLTSTATQTGQTATQTPSARPGGQQAAPAGTAWVLTPGGVRSADPRTPNSNYLALATLPPEQAQDALDFLAAKGLRAIAVPVDSGTRTANNPARYTLISLGLAVPSGQFSSTLQQRREHEALVRTLGTEWRRERRGGSDFSQTQWIRYNP
jgi:hypothetical protein